MDDSALALSIARGRIGFGVLALALPGAVAKAMTGHKAQGAEAMFTRMWGGRDLALGLGAVIALDHGSPVRGWLEGAATADAGDALASVLNRRQLSDNGFKATLAIAATSSVAHWFLSRRLDPAPEPQPGQPEAVVTGHHEPA